MIRRLRTEQRGASTVIVALCMTAVLIVVALVVDIGATAARKAQLQDAADAAALAIAQTCHEHEATTTRDGCAAPVVATAQALADGIANDTVFGGIEQSRTALSWPTDTAAPNARETVVVTLTSVQAALFSFDRDGTDVLASAEAEWRQTVPLPLGVNSCVLPDAGAVGPQFIGTGLYTGVQDLLGAVAAALGSDLDLPGYLENLFQCGVSVLAGGWLGNAADECSYDPRLLVSTLGSTLGRVLPLLPGSNECSDEITDLIGKRIIVPVFEHSTGQTVNQLLGFSGAVTFTEIVVTGYEFDGLLWNGPAANYPSGGPSCPASLNELLGLGSGDLSTLLRALTAGPLRTLLQLPVVGDLLDALGLDALLGVIADLLLILVPVTDLVNRLLDVLLPILGLCQGVQGFVVETGMNADQAAERIATPVRLVA